MITQSTQIPSDSEFGVCVKDRDGSVVFQNQLCTQACGNRIHLKCTTGCMTRFDRASAKSGDIHIEPTLPTDMGPMAAVIMTTQSTLTTLLSPLNSKSAEADTEPCCHE